MLGTGVSSLPCERAGCPRSSVVVVVEDRHGELVWITCKIVSLKQHNIIFNPGSASDLSVRAIQSLTSIITAVWLGWVLFLNAIAPRVVSFLHHSALS